MQDVPLTLTSILRHGANIHGDRVVITATEDGYRQVEYRGLGARVAQLANALRGLGVRPSDRVATFMWNNQEHLEAYFAIPCMGAVLHTLNIRLSDEQIEFIAYDAEDTVVLVDMSLAKQLASVLPRMETVRTVVAIGDGDTAVLETAGKDVHPLRRAVGRAADRVRVARHRRTCCRRNVLHQRHHRPPEGCGVRPPVDIPAQPVGVQHQRHDADRR